MFRIQFLLVLFLTVSLGRLSASSSDSLSLTPAQQRIAASIEEMSEPELVLMLDSLFDADMHDSILFVLINRQIDSLRMNYPKNQFENGFAFYPANRFYGNWNTRMLFPYSDSLYKADTLVTLDLSEEISGPFHFPFNGTITSTFGWRDSAFHRGVDIDLVRGDTVCAAFMGMVRYAGPSGGYGNVVIVRHYNGLETVYAHLWKIKCKPGDIVNSGQLLGLGGSTGHSTGTHLHFELRFRGVAINPAYIVDLQTHKLIADKIDLFRTRQGYAVRPVGMEFHTCVRGDNITKIAQQYGRSVKQIQSYNGWDGYVRLRAGDKVRIRPVQ